MRPLTGQTWLEIAQLRYFDLQLTLRRPGALGEDIEDKLGAVNHSQPEFLFEIARLHGAERIVKNGEGSTPLMRHFADIGGLTAPDESTGINRLQLLLNLSCDRCAGGFRQRA